VLVAFLAMLTSPQENGRTAAASIPTSSRLTAAHRKWTPTGMTTDDARIEVRGCELWTVRAGFIMRTDSFRKIVQPN
jgi:hypothetical protein